MRRRPRHSKPGLVGCSALAASDEVDDGRGVELLRGYCQERARRNFVIDQGQGGLSETMVCEAHAAALKAGERYVYDSVENVIYMGQDAPPQSR